MRKGSQEPTLLIRPEVASEDVLDGSDAARFASRFGLVLDPWQVALCELWMRRDVASGKWAAGTWGISVPRQNGKNGALEAVELYAMVVLRLRILHTAHEVKTARKHFARLKYFFGSKADDPTARFPQLNRLVREMRSVNGQEAIFLRNPDTGEDLGSVEVSARSAGAARGFTNDILVVDEAQHLKDDELEALRPAISAAPSGDPVAIYMGTPPKPEALAEDGVGSAFLRVRSRAVTGESKRAAWMEFSLGVDLDVLSDDEIRALAVDKANWYRVNPALGRRVFEQTIEDELGELGHRSVARERLNIWPVARKEGAGYLDLDVWRALAVVDVPSQWPLAALGLDMDPGTGRLWVSPAAFSPAGVHVELLPDDLLSEGTQRAVQWVWDRARRRRPVVMPAESPATVMVPDLLARGVKVYQLNGPEVAQASSGFEKAMKEATVSHYADPVLEACVKESERERYRGSGQFKFKRAGEFHAAPLYAAVCAHFGAVRWGRRAVDRSEGSVTVL